MTARTYLSWVRTGLSSAISGRPSAGDRASLPAQIALSGKSGRAAAVPVELAGPGDVIGIDSSEIRRCEPHPGCPDFEPDFLAYVELVSADLPWRFSPTAPTSTPLPAAEDPQAPGRTRELLMPWIALVVVPADQVTITSSDAGPALAECEAAQLPDPREAWAWAHATVTTTDPTPNAVQDPTTGFSRLLCPRRLQPHTAYRALIVPTYAAGLTTASANSGGNPLDPAWGTSGPVRLPIYYRFDFSTGDGGTFESLARRLRPRPMPESVAGRPIRLNAPGWGVVGRADLSVAMHGALRAVTSPETPLDAAYAAQLAAAISAQGVGLQLRPPIYGQDYVGGIAAIDPATPGWLTELNTDPRHRLAAGLGAWAATVNAEDLAGQAWQQLGRSGPASTGGNPELATAVGSALGTRFGSTGTMLDTTLARLARPGGPLSPRSQALTAPRANTKTTSTTSTPSSTRFAPTFSEPGFSYLSGVAPEWLLPGVEAIEDESVVVVQTNPAFTEAFLVGMNHALARELSWRRFPLDATATMISRFWATAPGGADTAVDPIASWSGGSALGEHTVDPEQLVLVVRGALLRRFPTAAVYLSGTQPDGSERQIAPHLQGRIGPGTTFIGFPLTADEARNPTAASGVTTWSIVLEEAVEHVRFGLDTATDTNPPVTKWPDLAWSHPQVDGRPHIPVEGPLTGALRPLRATVGASPPPPTAVWGADAANLAAILTRPAFRIKIPVGLWLTAQPGGAQ